MAPPTIIAHKSTFLTTQTLHLSQSLAPTTTWRQANEAAEDGLPARAVDDVLYRLNHALSQHARRVYAPQASRHVAEQIEGLFHEAAARALRGDHEDEADGENGDEGGERRRLRLGADFTTPDAIASLPTTWSTQNQREATEYPLEAQRYESLAERLKSLSARRQEVQARVSRLKRISALLAPFSPDNDKDEGGEGKGDGEDLAKPPSVQENLVTRNGELERELERMRLLLARVAGRVAQLPDGHGGDNHEDGSLAPGGDGAATDLMDVDSAERGKVERLLNNL
ncbi:kinetochore Sim4 complex subunit Fta4 [Xylaria intraflava]|nr:kinetochore Sim4 complex subunit Fta4 [Xylaria intraflava]